jgi:hypothetical protein
LFQSYISGHSTFSAAAATTLANFFGTDNVSFCANADPNAHDANNNPFAETRCFTSFTAAAHEAGISRIVGGIHFPSDNIQGLATGEMIADQVVANDFAAVPEPSSMAVLATGVLVVVGWRLHLRASLVTAPGRRPCASSPIGVLR